MRALVVEDEPIARNVLCAILNEKYPDLEIVGRTESVSETVEFLKGDNKADVIFMDVELADGTCFSIFDQVDINAVVVMTTAYDRYAIKAFERGAVDYLLKPIEPDEVQRAMSRVLKYNSSNVTNLLGALSEMGKIKERIMINLNGTITPLRVDNIAYIYSKNKANHIVTKDGVTYIVDKTIDQLMEALHDGSFFKISRSCILSSDCVKKLVKRPNGNIIVSPEPECDVELSVARFRVAEFLKWFAY